MRRIPISASRDYDVLLGSGLLSDCGGLISGVIKPCRAAVISDSVTGPLYGALACSSLLKAGFNPFAFTFEAGEKSKTLLTYSRILDFLAENGFDRSDVVVALGGGVTGDLAGFAAATYMRGIRLVQMPTTFLAAADSSVGGKTAIDLPSGKNLAGAFWPPSIVICDCDTFKTLPEEVFADGMAESVKHGLIADEDFFRRLCTADISDEMEDIVCRNVEIKQSFVQSDEFDRGRRSLLNFGHTIGHAIEKCSHFGVTHGRAVSIGMVCEARAACRLGFCSEDILPVLTDALSKFGLPTASTFSAEEIFNAAAADKKRDGDSVNVVCLKKIGEAGLVAMSLSRLKEFVAAGLEG